MIPINSLPCVALLNSIFFTPSKSEIIQESVAQLVILDKMKLVVLFI
jgi:hypothetical protein